MDWGTVLALVLAIALDRLFGEPRRFHPLVGLGHIARAIERRLNFEACSFGRRRLLGVVALWVLLAPLVWLAMLIENGVAPSAAASVLYGALVLYLVIGGHSLEEHALAVRRALDADDLALARQRVGYIVSRETGELDTVGVTRATLESVLENGSDALFAPLFWFVVAGPAGAVAYRVINTLDAMWGYRNPRFLAFGWAAARLDDLVNWVPARLCALTYAIVASKGRRYGRQGLRCWRQQAPACESPNAGPVMACGAGALNVELGGAAVYHGQPLWRPPLGRGGVPEPGDIDRALSLLRRGVCVWLVCITVLIMGKQVLSL